MTCTSTGASQLRPWRKKSQDEMNSSDEANGELPSERKDVSTQKFERLSFVSMPCEGASVSPSQPQVCFF